MSMSIKYMRLDEILGADENPKDHDIGTIIESIKRTGFNSQLIMNSSTKKLVAGHGRLEALIKMYKAEYSVPRNILKDEDGMWMVPVLSGVKFSTEEEALAYLLADNKLTEIGGWDDTKLANILADLSDDLSGVGFDEADIESLFNDLQQDFEVDDTDRGLGNARIKYRLVFDNTTHQTAWFKFLEHLNNTSDIESFSGRLAEYCKGYVNE